jgi:hypothetical protein
MIMVEASNALGGLIERAFFIELCGFSFPPFGIIRCIDTGEEEK